MVWYQLTSINDVDEADDRILFVGSLPEAIQEGRLWSFLGKKHHAADALGNSIQRSGRSALKDVVTREYTVHIQKFVRDKQFKKRTPNAIKGIILFARRHMGTKDVRIDPKLNEAVWAKGVRYPPRRIRIRLERELLGPVVMFYSSGLEVLTDPLLRFLS